MKTINQVLVGALESQLVFVTSRKFVSKISTHELFRQLMITKTLMVFLTGQIDLLQKYVPHTTIDQSGKVDFEQFFDSVLSAAFIENHTKESVKKMIQHSGTYFIFTDEKSILAYIAEVTLATLESFTDSSVKKQKSIYSHHYAGAELYLNALLSCSPDIANFKHGNNFYNRAYSMYNKTTKLWSIL